MAGKNDDVNEDNIFDEGEMEDDGTAELIRNALKDEDDDIDDDGGFDQPLDAKAGDEPDVVSPDEGRDLLDDADMAKNKGKNPGEKEDPAPTPEDKAKTAENDPAKPGDDKAEDNSLTTADVTALLDGVPDDRRGEITRRLSDAEKVLAPFKSKAAELERFGQTPEGAINRLIELNSFAQAKPDEYLAWVATQTSRDEPHKALEGAAKLLGFKLTKDGDEDDDLFLDPEVKAMKEENERLKRQLNGDAPSFGPDTPERTQQRTVQEQLQSFINETDETGQLKRPAFLALEGVITQMAQSHIAQTGKPATIEDLDRFYTQAADQMRQTFGGGGSSAAQAQPSVSDQIKTKAAAAQRAQRASKSVDGTGQGASRRPALADDAPLEDVIRHFASQE